MKREIFEVIQSTNKDNKANKVFDICIISLICLNVIMIIVDTFNFSSEIQKISYLIEFVSVIIFTIEYILRIWTSEYLYPSCSKLKAASKYIFSVNGIIDLLAIIPFYFQSITNIDLRSLRLVRMVRIFSIFKLKRYTNAFNTIHEVIAKKSYQLSSSVFVLMVFMIITSLIMYDIEHEYQPEVFKNAFSGLWWASAAFTTVGYGDIHPITPVGQLLSMVVSILGIGLLAVPTSIIAAGFIELLDTKKQQGSEAKKYCPYCGEKLE